MSQDPIFKSEDNFRQAFLTGLEKMLTSDELGAFVLVLANASFDAEIYNWLKKRLARRFEWWVEQFQRYEEAQMQYAADDVAVFKQLMKLGVDALSLTEQRMQDIWQLQYNQLRSFRPARNAGRKFTTISEAFDPGGFNFNKPFLQKEVFWQGEILGRQVKLLYNKFPFASLHGLFVIEPDDNKPQLLQKQDHEFVWQFLQALDPDLAMGMGYNSLGAYASINHQHFQSFVSKKKYPIELACWEHNGGTMHYPLACRKFVQVEEAWSYLDSLHAANIPYNLLYRGDEMFCINRAFQGSYQHSNWTAGFAWSETAGVITTASMEDFHGLDTNAIQAEMLKLRRT